MNLYVSTCSVRTFVQYRSLQSSWILATGPIFPSSWSLRNSFGVMYFLSAQHMSFRCIFSMYLGLAIHHANFLCIFWQCIDYNNINVGDVRQRALDTIVCRFRSYITTYCIVKGRPIDTYRLAWLVCMCQLKLLWMMQSYFQNIMGYIETANIVTHNHTIPPVKLIYYSSLMGCRNRLVYMLISLIWKFFSISITILLFN